MRPTSNPATTSKPSLWLSAVIALGLAVYVENFAKSSIGTIASILLFVILFVISLQDLSKGIVLSWVIAALIPETPRDILDVYEALQVDKSVQYNVISSVTIGPASLLLHLFLLNTLLCLLKISKSSVTTWKVAAIWIFFMAGTTGLFYESASGNRISAAGPIITDFKFPLLLTLGLVQGAYLKHSEGIHHLSNAIMMLPLILGARVVFFMLGDFIQGMPKLDVMTHPLLSTCVLAYCITRHLPETYSSFASRILLYLSLMNASRGLLAIQACVILLAIVVMRKQAGAHHLRRASELAAIGALIVAAVAVASPRLFDFLLWKLSDIDFVVGESELSGSGQVRAYELKNIISAMSTPVTFAVGKGFGGSFDFKKHPMPSDIELDLKSYSEQQLKNGVFYNPHSFFSSILLKYGTIGIILYFTLPVYIFIYSNDRKTYFGGLLSLLAVVSIYNYYWRIEYMLLIGIIFSATSQLPRRTEKPAGAA